jgi:hypothetical protein
MELRRSARLETKRPLADVSSSADAEPKSKRRKKAAPKSDAAHKDKAQKVLSDEELQAIYERRRDACVPPTPSCCIIKI